MPLRITARPLTVPPGNLNQSAIRHHDQEPALVSSNVIDTSSLKSSVDSAAKSTLRRIAESSKTYFPLKSVAKNLCFILDNCEVWSPSQTLDSWFLQLF